MFSVDKYKNFWLFSPGAALPLTINLRIKHLQSRRNNMSVNEKYVKIVNHSI